MEKLTIRDISPYLPYDLVGIFRSRKETLKSCTKTFINREILYPDFKPILHPLSDLTKSITYNGEKFYPFDYILENYSRDLTNVLDDSRWIYDYPYFIVQKLLEWHFNVFDLPQELWVDVNSLDENPYQ